MATRSITSRISMEGADDIRRALGQLSDAGSTAFKAIAEAVKQPNFEKFKSDTAEAGRQLRAAKSSADQLGESLQNAGDEGDRAAQRVANSWSQTGEKIAGVAVKVTTVFGVIAAAAQVAIVSFAKLGAEASTKIVEAADEAKLTVATYQRLKQEAASAGVSTDEFNESIGRATKTMADAKGGFATLGNGVTLTAKKLGDSVVTIVRTGTALKGLIGPADEAATKLAKIGILPKDLLTLSSDELLHKITTNLAAIKDEQLRTALASGILGEKWKDMLQGLNSGNKNLEGSKAGTEALAASVAAASDKIKTSFKELTDEIGTDLDADQKKALTDLGTAITNLQTGTGSVDKVKNALSELFGTLNDDDAGAKQRIADLRSTIEGLGNGVTAVKSLTDAAHEGTASLLKVAESYSELGKRTRELTPEQIGAGNHLTKAWKDLSAAIDATKNQIGALFFDSQTKHAEWLTQLVDGSRALVLEWIKAKQISFGAFLTEQGGSAGLLSTVLGTLREISAALGQIWVNVLVPAGKAIVDGLGSAAAAINQFLGTKLTAADLGIGAVLSFLIGGFNSLAIAVAAVFGGTTPEITVFNSNLKSIGVDVDAIKAKIKELFADIVSAFSGGAVKNEWVTPFVDALKSLPAILLGVGAALLLLRERGASITPVFNKIFGTALRGESIFVLGVLSQMSGALDFVEKSLLGLAAGIAILDRLFTAIVRISGPIGGLVVGLILLIAYGDKIQFIFDGAAAAINKFLKTVSFGLITDSFVTGAEVFNTAIGTMAASLAILITRAAGGVAALAILAGTVSLIAFSVIAFGASVLAVMSIIKNLSSLPALNEFNKRLAEIKKEQADGTITAAQYDEKMKALTADVIAYRKSMGVGDTGAKKELDDAKIAAEGTGASLGKLTEDARKLVAGTNDAGSSVKDLSGALNTLSQGAQSTVMQRINDAFKALGFSVSDVATKIKTFPGLVTVADALERAKNGAGELASSIKSVPADFALRQRMLEFGQGIVAAKDAAVELVKPLTTLENPAAVPLIDKFKEFQDLIGTSDQKINTLDTALDQFGDASPVDRIKSAFDQLNSTIDTLFQKFQELAGLKLPSPSASDGGGDTGGGFAVGGYTGGIAPHRIAGVVHGREYVEPAHVVARPGVLAFLETLRRSGDLHQTIARFARGFSEGGFVNSLNRSLSSLALPGFAARGFVPALSPSMSGGGRTGLHPVPIHFNGRRVGELLGTPSAIRELQKEAALQHLTSLGPAPSSVR